MVTKADLKRFEAVAQQAKATYEQAEQAYEQARHEYLMAHQAELQPLIEYEVQEVGWWDKWEDEPSTYKFTKFATLDEALAHLKYTGQATWYDPVEAYKGKRYTFINAVLKDERYATTSILIAMVQE